MHMNIFCNSSPFIGEIFKNHNSGSKEGEPAYFMVVIVSSSYVKLIGLYNYCQIKSLPISEPDRLVEFQPTKGLNRFRTSKFADTEIVYTCDKSLIENGFGNDITKNPETVLGYEMAQLFYRCSKSEIFTKDDRIEFMNKYFELI